MYIDLLLDNFFYLCCKLVKQHKELGPEKALSGKNLAQGIDLLSWLTDKPCLLTDKPFLSKAEKYCFSLISHWQKIVLI